MTARIAIDLNVRVRGNQTYAGLEDVQGDIAAGSTVEVYEPESGLAGPAEVVEVDLEKQLVYLAVDWHALRQPSVPAGQRWAIGRILTPAVRELVSSLLRSVFHHGASTR